LRLISAQTYHAQGSKAAHSKECRFITPYLTG